MNPGWLIAGLHIGERIAPHVRRHGPKLAKRVVRETWWKAEAALESWRGHHAYRKWLDAQPVTTERG